MVLVLCIGDLHIPYRAVDIPKRFKDLLRPGKIHHVLATGNLCSNATYQYLKTICGDVHWTRGDFDDQKSLPEHKVVQVEGFKLALCHGHQLIPWGDASAKEVLQRQLDVDILVSGHTHVHEVKQSDGVLYVNPGTATGAEPLVSVAGGPATIPSFVLMDISGTKLSAYVYKIVDGELAVERIDHEKPQPPAEPAGGSASVASGLTA